MSKALTDYWRNVVWLNEFGEIEDKELNSNNVNE
jgi:hypothetical protein